MTFAREKTTLRKIIIIIDLMGYDDDDEVQPSFYPIYRINEQKKEEN